MPVDVHVVTPDREVWSGETPLLIARGIDGELGIMGGHMPILVQLAVGPLRITRDGGEDVIVVDGGFLHVATEDGVTRADVLAADAVPAAEVDIDAAKRALEELKAAETDPGSKVLLFKIDPTDSAGAGRGPEIISNDFTYFGTYSARLKVPAVKDVQPNTGAVVGYFTYYMDNVYGLSEIDFEWLVADPSIIYIGTWTGYQG